MKRTFSIPSEIMAQVPVNGVNAEVGTSLRVCGFTYQELPLFLEHRNRVVRHDNENGKISSVQTSLLTKLAMEIGKFLPML